jgi:hypothetical protein
VKHGWRQEWDIPGCFQQAQIGYWTRHELTVDVEIVLFDRSAQSWNVDWNMDDAEKGECEHGGYRAGQSSYINAAKFWGHSQYLVLILHAKMTY